MQIHIDIGKVTTTNKNEKATKIHPQGPSSALGLSVETKTYSLWWAPLPEQLCACHFAGCFTWVPFLILTQTWNTSTYSFLTFITHRVTKQTLFNTAYLFWLVIQHDKKEEYSALTRPAYSEEDLDLGEGSGPHQDGETGAGLVEHNHRQLPNSKENASKKAETKKMVF